MKIRVGYELIYDFPQPTPMIVVLGIHYTRASDVIVPDHLTTEPVRADRRPTATRFGNWCSRLRRAGRAHAPGGRWRRARHAACRTRWPRRPSQHAVEELPAETLVFLLGSRYCETDRLSDVAWELFGKTPPGWARVQAICDFVHHHITFGYQHARPTRTAWEAFNEGNGVCRDYAHLAITFCRCMNIPARYCTGYLGRHRHAAALCADGLRRLVRGLSRRALVHVRRAQQRPAHRPRADRAGVATPPTWRSPTPSAPTRWSASRSGRTRSSSRPPAPALRRAPPGAAPGPAGLIGADGCRPREPGRRPDARLLADEGGSGEVIAGGPRPRNPVSPPRARPAGSARASGARPARCLTRSVVPKLPRPSRPLASALSRCASRFDAARLVRGRDSAGSVYRARSVRPRCRRA